MVFLAVYDDFESMKFREKDGKYHQNYLKGNFLLHPHGFNIHNNLQLNRLLAIT